MDDHTRTPAARKANYVGARPKDPSKLSTKPSQIRNRLRRNAGKLEKAMDVDMAMLYGKSLQEWDLEELARGRPRNKDGKFNGAAPRWITPQIQMEAKRRLLEETHGLLAGHIHQAVRTMGELLISDEVDYNGKPIVDARTRFAAAAFIIEHMIGKPQAVAKLEIEVDKTKQAIAAAIVLDDGEAQDGGVIDGDVVDDEDEDGE